MLKHINACTGIAHSEKNKPYFWSISLEKKKKRNGTVLLRQIEMPKSVSLQYNFMANLTIYEKSDKLISYPVFIYI